MGQNHAWKNPKVVDSFIDNGRKAIPFGEEQIDIMMRLITGAVPSVRYFVDLGCGDGILSHAILTEYPEASGLLMDYSEPMLNSAKKRLSNYTNLGIEKLDFSSSEWTNFIKQPVDVVVSGFAIHHLSHERKYDLYKEIFKVLSPGGVFVNIEHVASESTWGEGVFDELMIDNKYYFLNSQGKGKSRDTIEEEYNNRLDKYDNILLSVNTQCNWLREIGFSDVDCYFKCFELSVFAGRKIQK